MTEEKSHVRALLVIFLVLFLFGLFLGYYIWGFQKQRNPDYKEMLQQTIAYITTLEEKNQELAKGISGLENEVSSLKKQQEMPENNQITKLNERVAVLEKENVDLKSVLSQNEALSQENQQLRQKVQALVEDMNASRPPRSPGGSPPVQTPSQPGSAPN
jgi:cell division protein FtsB